MRDFEEWSHMACGRVYIYCNEIHTPVRNKSVGNISGLASFDLLCFEECHV